MQINRMIVFATDNHVLVLIRRATDRHRQIAWVDRGPHETIAPSEVAGSGWRYRGGVVLDASLGCFCCAPHRNVGSALSCVKRLSCSEISLGISSGDTDASSL